MQSNSANLQAQITAMRAKAGPNKAGQQQRNSQTMTQMQALQVNQTLVNQKHHIAASSNTGVTATTLQISSPRQQQNQSMNI